MFISLKSISTIFIISIFLQFLTIGKCCVEISDSISFTDFAERSDIVLRVRTLELLSWKTDRSSWKKKANLQVVGLFPKKSGGFKIGEKIKAGPFGIGPACVNIKAGTQLILFLNKNGTFTSANNSKVWKINYNPVPASRRNVIFYKKVISGDVTDDMRLILPSGCPPLQIANGGVNCNPTKQKCEIICRFGYQLSPEGTGLKICNGLTGIWQTQPIPTCKRSLKKRGISRFGRRFGRNRSNSINRRQISEEEEENEEEEEEEDKKYYKKLSSKSKQKKRRIDIQSLLSMFKDKVENDSKNSKKFNQKERDKSDLKKESNKELKVNQSKISKLPNKEETNQTVQSKPSTIESKNGTSQNITNEKSDEAETIPRHMLVPPIAGRQIIIVRNNLKNTTLDGKLVEKVENDKSEEDILKDDIPLAEDYTSKPSLIPSRLFAPLLSPINTVVGCPSVSGTIQIHSIWPGGFNGMAYFAKSKFPIHMGWLATLRFSVNIRDIAPFNAELMAKSQSGFSFLVTPKPYAKNIYYGQDLTIGFNGVLSSNFNIQTIKGSAQLLGVCSVDNLLSDDLDMLLPFDDMDSDVSDAWILDGEYLELGIINQKDVDIVPPNIITVPPPPTTKNPDISEPDDYCTIKSANGRKPATGKTVFNVTSETDQTIDYRKVLEASILFYEAQRSGKLPKPNRVPWRGDSNLNDGCLIGKDLSGGWYDGSGSIKTTFTTAFSTTILSWGAIQFRAAYEAANQLKNLYQQLKWSCDYLIKCHISTNQLVVQVGSYHSSDMSWQSPEADLASSRKVYIVNETNPGTDVAAEVSAALASASLFFRKEDPSYATKCLKHSMELYRFASKFRGVFSNAVPGHEQKYFSSNGAEDELVWASIWLFQATRDFAFMKTALDGYEELDEHNSEFFWDEKHRGITVLLAKITKQMRFRKVVWAYIDWLQQTATKSPSGIVSFNRNHNMHAANAAFLVASSIRLAENSEKAQGYAQFARNQMELLLGKLGQSFVVGFGPNYPKKPHHRASSCPTYPDPCTSQALYGDKENPHKLYGALVSGADQQGRYSDVTHDDLRNDVSVVANAGFQSLAAALLQLEINQASPKKN